MCALTAGVANCAILASDISSAALNAARRAEYEPAKVAALPPGWKDRYTSQIRRDHAESVVISPLVRNIVSFSAINLLQPFSHLGHFDVIFCRNVMIYFDQSTRDSLIERLVEQLVPGGYLFTGHSETLLRLPAGLKYVQPATYRKT
jgi:chemotaxis protein methyltransferase CheR